MDGGGGVKEEGMCVVAYATKVIECEGQEVDAAGVSFKSIGVVEFEPTALLVCLESQIAGRWL